MGLPCGDAELVQITDAAFSDAARRAGGWLACAPGCTQCCHGAFGISVLDAARLEAGMRALAAADPAAEGRVRERAEAWVREHGPAFPGDPATGVIGESPSDGARFEEFAPDAPCPALDPTTGLCDLYAWRPMTCRVFGPPIRMEGGLACCELCFRGASDDEIAACEMALPLDLESEVEGRLAAEAGERGETVVAFALLRGQRDGARNR